MKIIFSIFLILLSFRSFAVSDVIKELFYGIELSKNVEKTARQLASDPKFSRIENKANPQIIHLYRGEILECNVLGHKTDLSIIHLEKSMIGKAICSDCNRKPVQYNSNVLTITHIFPSEDTRQTAYLALENYLKLHNLKINISGRVEKTRKENEPLEKFKFPDLDPRLSINKPNADFSIQIIFTKYYNLKT